MTRSAPEADPWTLVPPIASWVPECDYTLGAEFAEVATLAGMTPDPEQRLILDAAAAVTSGKSTSRDVGICAPRQNLKTGSLKQLALGYIYVLELPLVTWTAHLTTTSADAFRDMIELIESCPDLEAEVTKVSHSNGHEGFEFTGGRRLAFRARTKGGGRGLTGNRIFLDEAMYVTAMQLAALAPTLRAVPDPQLVFAGSAGFADSFVWRTLRDRGRAGGDPFLAWLEWASDLVAGGCEVEGCAHGVGTPGCALDDVERLLRSNPAIGRRMSLDSLHADRLLMPPPQYAVETLGWWEDPAGATLGLDVAKWTTQLLDEESHRAPDSPIAIAFDVDPERTQGSIAMFGLREDGLGHTELVQHGYDIGWLVPRLVALAKARKPVAVVVASQAPAAALAPDLIKAGIEVTFASQTDYARACGAYRDAVDQASMRHIGEPILTASVGAVTKKPVGSEGAFIWNRASGADITAAVAATLARWGFMSTVEERTAPSAYFFGPLECQDCDCPERVAPGETCKDCGHMHDDPPEPVEETP